MKDDCFAYREVTNIIGPNRISYESAKCACLREMVCAMGECPFYRSNQEYEKSMMELYGTTDVEAQIKQYVAGKENEQ